MTIAKWIALNEMRPMPEVYVLCWDGKTVSVDWFGSLIRPQGTSYTHWAPFELPPGASSPMLDGRLAFTGHPPRAIADETLQERVNRGVYG